MDKEHSLGTHPIMHVGAIPAIVELMTEMWGLLTEEQIKKVMGFRCKKSGSLAKSEKNLHN